MLVIQAYDAEPCMGAGSKMTKMGAKVVYPLYIYDCAVWVWTQFEQICEGVGSISLEVSATMPRFRGPMFFETLLT